MGGMTEEDRVEAREKTGTNDLLCRLLTRAAVKKKKRTFALIVHMGIFQKASSFIM